MARSSALSTKAAKVTKKKSLTELAGDAAPSKSKQAKPVEDESIPSPAEASTSKSKKGKTAKNAVKTSVESQAEAERPANSESKKEKKSRPKEVVVEDAPSVEKAEDAGVKKGKKKGAIAEESVEQTSKNAKKAESIPQSQEGEEAGERKKKRKSEVVEEPAGKSKEKTKRAKNAPEADSPATPAAPTASKSSASETKSEKKRKVAFAIEDSSEPSSQSPANASKKARAKGNAASAKPAPEPEAEVDEEDEDEAEGGAEDGAEEDDFYGFSSDDDDSSDEEDMVDDIPGIDIGKLPTVAKDDETVKRKLEKAKRKPTEDRGVIHLGRIPHGFYEDQMRAYFSQFGTVTRLRLSRSKKTGKSKHYGFIEFDSSSVAQIVAETMDNYLLMGHILTCKVIPKDDVHPQLWVGANKKWRRVPRDRIARVTHNKPRTEDETAKAESRLLKRQEQRKRKLEEAGIKYDFEAVAYKKKPKPTEA